MSAHARIPIPRLACLLAILWIFCPAPSWAQEEFCGLPTGVNGFLMEVFSLSTEGGVADPSQLRRLRVMLNLVEAEDISGGLNASSGPEVGAAFEAVKDHARAILSGGQAGARPEIFADIGTVWGASDSHCASKRKPAPMLGTSNGTGVSASAPETDEGGQGGQVTGMTGAGSPASRADVLEDTPAQTWMLGLLIALLMIGTAALWLLHMVRARLRARRKGCRIAAGFESDLDVVDGYVMELSRKRMVFKPVNAGAFKRMCLILADLGEDGDFVVLGELRVEVCVEDIGAEAVLFRLVKSLPRAQMEEALRHSLISPFVIDRHSVSKDEDMTQTATAPDTAGASARVA